MTLAQFIPLAIQVSMALGVLWVGLNATPADLSYLFRKPGLLARSLIAMNVVLPLFAVAIAVLFQLHHAVEIALVVLSVSPVPPILPKKEMKAGGTGSYIVALLAVASLVSIFFVPAAVEFLVRVFGRDARVVGPGAIAWAFGTSILAPLLVGIILRALAPNFAARIARPLSIFATALLVVAFAPVLFRVWGSIVALIGNFTLLAIGVVILVGLAVGHLLGGPDPDDRTVLALSTATRHPGVALAVAHVSAPNEPAVMAAVLLYLLVGALVSVPYVKWRELAHARAARRGVAR
jgi:bile acid:Na+ symporter, BASS family